MRPPDRVRPGQRAEHGQFNSLLEFLISLGLIVRRPLRLIPDGTGTALIIDDQDQFWARLVSHLGGGAYAWHEQVKASTGWVDLYRSDFGGSDAAYEANNVTTLTAGTRVFLKRQENGGILIFQDDPCA